MYQNLTKMRVTYTISGFSQYVIIDKILYKKAKVCKSDACKFQYRTQREIKRCFKNGIEGYYLEKQRIVKFYPLTKLKHRLKIEHT